MPDLILTGYVQSPEGPQEFAVYRHLTHRPGPGTHFTCVDTELPTIGWVTLNASGGLPAFAAEHKVYFPTREACQAGLTAAKMFPVDELSHAEDVSDAEEMVKAGAARVAAGSVDTPNPQDPTAEDYSDMLRHVFFQWAAGGYNDEGGLVPLDKAKAKLQWVIEEAARHAVTAQELTNAQCQAACSAYEESMGGERLPDGDGKDYTVVRAMFRAAFATSAAPA